MSYDKNMDDLYQSQYLYIEEYPININDIKDIDEEEDDDSRGVIIIEIL